METDKKTAHKKLNVDGSKLKITILTANFHPKLIEELLTNVKKELQFNKVKTIEVIEVPDALEIPFICKKVLERKKTDAIIALGLVIRGKTTHYELVTESVYQGLMNLQTPIAKIPIIFGVLACENLKQAQERISAKALNKGKQFAQTALLQIQTSQKI